MASRKPSMTTELLQYWKSFVFVLTPVIFSPLPIYYASTENNKMASCGYVVIIMAVYWSGEVLPLAVTSLLPIVLFPLLGVQSAKDVSINYAKDAIFLLTGSLLFAVAVERWGLHKRIALRVLLTVGVEPRRLMFGMMSATAFLSMWISNTATTAMMIPTVETIISQLSCDHEEGDDKMKETVSTDEKTVLLSTAKSASARELYVQPKELTAISHGEDTDDAHLYEDEEKARLAESSAEQTDKLAKGLLLCTCYAANIGGIATLTGTSTNVMAAQVIQTLYPRGKGIDFATWFSFGFPTMVLILLLAYFWLQWLFLDDSCLPGCMREEGCRGSCQSNQSSAAYQVIKRHYDELGPLSFPEKVVAFHFVLLVLLWFFRDMTFVHLENGQAAGWTYFFVRGYVSDASTVIVVVIFLFFWPARRPNFMCCRTSEDTDASEPAPSILEWSTTSRKMPWGLLLLVGGGFALADGIKVSGLSSLMGQVFQAAAGFPPAALVVIVTTIVAFLTELVSNAPVAAIFLPILANLAEGTCIHPYYLMVPATIACSFAFMLPVGNPPNAIVVSCDRIQVYDMIRSGFTLNLVGILVLNVAINTYGIPLYQLNHSPSWAQDFCTGNRTAAGGFSSPLLNATLHLVL